MAHHQLQLLSLRGLPPATARFAQLLNSRGGFSAPKSAIAAVEGMGTGLVATAEIEAGETVLTIDKSLWAPFSERNAFAQAVSAAPDFVNHIGQTAARIENRAASDLAQKRSNFEDRLPRWFR